MELLSILNPENAFALHIAGAVGSAFIIAWLT